MMREFLRVEELRGLVAARFGSDRRLVALDRVTGGSKKGVYRLRLDDGLTVILYVWAAGENYWPPSPTAVPDDPFTDASGAALFAAAHAALTGAGVRVPHLLVLDQSCDHLDADLALIEDVGAVRLETLLRDDRAAAAAPLEALGDALRRMHTTASPWYGRLLGRTESGQRPAEDVIVDRALAHLDAATALDGRLASHRDRIAAHVLALRDAIGPRQSYRLIHGELGPDHVFVTPAGEAVVIDIEGLTFFDVEWEHAFLRLRFGDDYPALRPVDLDPRRLRLYDYAQTLSLVEGPLRIAATDFPGRDFMLDLAERNIAKALAAVQ
ncbi:phosphotransferase family protein [Dactylosporangium sp. NPDC000521]|uniref:phosphotransferase family protein n=1 Tax=Dactylosporangium sp. NPDC000521 TaxID=3363975 RepID=UPI00367ECC45